MSCVGESGFPPFLSLSLSVTYACYTTLKNNHEHRKHIAIEKTQKWEKLKAESSQTIQLLCAEISLAFCKPFQLYDFYMHYMWLCFSSVCKLL